MSVIDSRSGVQGWIAEARAASAARARGQSRGETATFDVVDLLAVPEAAWADLAGRAIEANAFYHATWARAVSRHAEGKSGARALIAWDGPSRKRLIGLLPVIPAWRACRLPVPVFVAWQAYSPLSTPLLDRDKADIAARALVAAAAKGGAMALLLPAFAQDGPAAAAMRAAIAPFGIAPKQCNKHERASLDATQDGEEAIRAIGAKKIKELRRQRNRLGDNGDVVFKLAAPGAEADAAIDDFLALEAAGWKGAQGTALASKQGDATFMRAALPAMVADGTAEVATLSAGSSVVAAGVLLRHLRRSFFFKIAYDERAAKMSPGVQITLDITRQLCADDRIDDVDSTAVARHPMIDHIWRARQPVADWLVPVVPGKLSFFAVSAAIGVRHVLRGAACSLIHRIRALKG